jgi:hypothetical protein
VDLLTQLRTYLAMAKIRLFKSSFNPTPANVQADYLAAECDFTGYPAGGIAETWSPVGTDFTYAATIAGSRSFFQATDGVAPNDVGGMWIESAGGVVEYYCKFATPVPLRTALSWLAVTPYVQLPGPGFVNLES